MSIMGLAALFAAVSLFLRARLKARMFGLKLNLTLYVLSKTWSNTVLVTFSDISRSAFNLAIASSLIVSSSRQMPSSTYKASLFYMGVPVGSEAYPLT